MKNLLLFLIITITIHLHAQDKQKMILDSIQHNSSNNAAMIPELVDKIGTYTIIIDKNTAYLEKRIKLNEIITTIPGVEKLVKRIKGSLDSGKRSWNLRGLNSTSILLKGTASDLKEYKNTLTTYSTTLTKNSAELKKILKDPLMQASLQDSILNMQLQDIQEESIVLDSNQKKVLTSVNILRNRVTIALLQANDIISDLAEKSLAEKRNMWGPEEAPLLTSKASSYKKSFATVIEEAFKRLNKSLKRYYKNNFDVLALTLLLFIFMLVWSFINMRNLKNLPVAPLELHNIFLYRRSIILVNLFGFFTYAPFFFPSPTMSFLHTFELFRLLSLIFLVTPFIAKSCKPIFFILCTLWFLYAVDDLLLQSAYGERWWLLIMAVVLIVVCLPLIFRKENFFIGLEESPMIKYVVLFTLFLASLSVLFNLLGRVTLAKICGVTAIQTLQLALALKVFCTIVTEAIYIQSEAYQQSRFSAYINFKELQHKLKHVLLIIALVVWAVYLARDLALYEFFKSMLNDFLSKGRRIGSLAFNFKNVGVFFLIIWVSTLLSGFINFFFGQTVEKTTGKRSSLGSMLLLIRLSIWTVGFFVAVAASGIPLDKLSIMIGALSVGIGFGLQTIVNNLVSGIIIAFERPIQVGDQIEVGNKSGVVKEIGVRSSTIKSSSGADIIIPNGDLLSQHLINWTLQDRNRRVEFAIGLSFDSDIVQVRKIIKETISKNDRILQTPSPEIVLNEFTEKNVEIKVLFWVPDLSTATSVRSHMMLEIYEALKAAGIQPGYSDAN
ncbi:MAG: mechanosensitive ion channel domain-containing protein [Flavobacterium sp.]|uniref:mechanosensitive ion channel family protein n=1 Tax=Flavobacterium sp. TaxID=239 RepID=UPI00326792D1